MCIIFVVVNIGQSRITITISITRRPRRRAPISTSRSAAAPPAVVPVALIVLAVRVIWSLSLVVRVFLVVVATGRGVFAVGVVALFFAATE